MARNAWQQKKLTRMESSNLSKAWGEQERGKEEDWCTIVHLIFFPKF